MARFRGSVRLVDGSPPWCLDRRRPSGRRTNWHRLGALGIDVAQFRMHELAEVTGADLLVIGSSRRGLLGRVLIGDDTRRAQRRPVRSCDRTHRVLPRAVGDGRGRCRLRRLTRERPCTRTGQVGRGRASRQAIRATYGDPVEELTLYSASLDLPVIGSRGYRPARPIGLNGPSQMRRYGAAVPTAAAGTPGRLGIEPQSRVSRVSERTNEKTPGGGVILVSS